MVSRISARNFMSVSGIPESSIRFLKFSACLPSPRNKIFDTDAA